MALSEPEPAVNAGSGHSPLSAFRKFINFLSGRFGREAMIAPGVRNTRLIALPSRSSPVPTFGNIQGFREDDPLCFERSTGGMRGSARPIPQTCSKGGVRQRFDLVGMVDWLRQRHPQSVGYNVEVETGIPAATVENWLMQRSQPSAAHFAALIHAYGPALLEACMHRAPDWVASAARIEQTRLIDEEISRLERKRAALEARHP